MLRGGNPLCTEPVKIRFAAEEVLGS